MRLWGVATCFQVQHVSPFTRKTRTEIHEIMRYGKLLPIAKYVSPFIRKQELSYMRLHEIIRQVAPQCNYVSLFIRKTRTELYEIIWDMASCSPMQLCLPIHNENKNWVIWDLRHRMHSEVSVNWFATLIIIFCKNCLDCLLLPQSRF